MPRQVNPEDVITRLTAQIGQLHAEIAMRDVALDAADKQIAQLEAATTAKEPTESAGFPAPHLEAPAA